MQTRLERRGIYACMQLNLSPAQMRELLELVHLGGHVRALAREVRKEDAGDAEHALEDELAAQMLLQALPGITLADDGKAVVDDRALDDLHALLGEYDEERFWEALEQRLGLRDFERNKTPQDQDIIDRTHRMPEHVQKLFERYELEFETYGIDRLEINPEAPVSDVRDLL